MTMHKSLFVTSLAALVCTSQPLIAAELPSLGSTVLVAQQNQNQNQVENQNQVQNQAQNQNQNRSQAGNEENDNGSDNGNGNGSPIMTRAEAQKLDGYVCFFEDADFAGEALCTGPEGHSNSLGAAWNDRISSIELAGQFEVTVCTDPDFQGSCLEVRTSAANLTSEFDNAISSWKVSQ